MLRTLGEGQGRRPVCEGDTPAVRATEEGAPLPRPHLCLYPIPSPFSIPWLPGPLATTTRRKPGLFLILF